jgi:LuxR family maltose regulon positive regulatory protein
MVALMKLQLDAAEKILREDLAAATQGELWAIHAFACALLGALRGDNVTHLVEIRDAIAARPDVAATGGNAIVLAAGQAELLVGSGQSAAARELLDRLPTDAIGASGGLRASLYGRIHLLAGDAGRALAVATRQLARSDTGPLGTADLLLIAAVAHLREGNTDKAAEYFRHCGALVSSHSVLIAFARVPRAELEALTTLTGRDLSTETWAALAETNGAPPDGGPTVDLTEREREVLTLLLDGASIDDIARARFVARNTVKTQLRSIYKKFGTSSREETIRAARSLGRW